MAVRLFSNAEVADIVESEGLGYAVKDYMSGNSIQDPVLARKWDEAKSLLYEIELMLFPGGFDSFNEPPLPDDDDDDWDEDDDDDDDDDDDEN